MSPVEVFRIVVNKTKACKYRHRHVYGINPAPVINFISGNHIIDTRFNVPDPFLL